MNVFEDFVGKTALVTVTSEKNGLIIQIQEIEIVPTEIIESSEAGLILVRPGERLPTLKVPQLFLNMIGPFMKLIQKGK